MIKTIVVPIEYIQEGTDTSIGKRMFALIESAWTDECHQLDVYLDVPRESNENDIDAMIENGVEFGQMVWEPNGKTVRFLSDQKTVNDFLTGFVNLQ